MRVAISVTAAALAILAAAISVSAVDPTRTPTRDPLRARDTIPAVLGLSWDEIHELRHDGLTLAEIAGRQSVEPQALIDALVAQWAERIEARVEMGALTGTEAANLESRLAVRAKAMVYQERASPIDGSAVTPGVRPGHGPWTGSDPGAPDMGPGNAGCDAGGPGSSRGG